jgi:hypothetical protein
MAGDEWDDELRVTVFSRAGYPVSRCVWRACWDSEMVIAKEYVFEVHGIGTAIV